MARRKRHEEEHVNHEAWAIPYGDLVTLLLAFFVVMYAVSSVNEGKYRVLSDSLVAAFRGQPHSFDPVPVGDRLVKVQQDDTVAGIRPSQALKFRDSEDAPNDRRNDEADKGLQAQLRQMADDLQAAMQPLIDKELIRVQREPSWVEVEIRTDILFPSGSAEIEPAAVAILERLAALLAERPYPIRIEGHTDDRPINTLQFPSNWELSAARAARIVRLFEQRQIASTRMIVAGMGSWQPVADNLTAEGRNRNRRVAIVILGAPPADGSSASAPESASASTTASTEVSATAAIGPTASAPVPAPVANRKSGG